MAGAETVDPIGVYDPRSVREVVKEYTTALNLVPKRGYRYIFAVVEDPRELHAFRKVLIRPESPEDVRLATRLAREGKRVLLVLPAGDDRIAREVSRELGVHPKPAELRLRPVYPDVRDQMRVWELVIGSRLPIDPSRVAPKYRPIRSKALPEVYRVDGRWFEDVRVGRGTVRVVGVDLPVVATRLHPTPAQLGHVDPAAAESARAGAVLGSPGRVRGGAASGGGAGRRRRDRGGCGRSPVGPGQGEVFPRVARPRREDPRGPGRDDGRPGGLPAGDPALLVPSPTVRTGGARVRAGLAGAGPAVGGPPVDGPIRSVTGPLGSESTEGGASGSFREP